MVDILNIFEEMANTTSINEKIRILRENKSEIIRDILILAYDRHITFGISKLEIDMDYDNFISIPLEKWLIEIFDILDSLSKRIISGNKARLTLLNSIKKANRAWGIIIYNILNKDLRLGINEKIINKVYISSISSEFCQLASPFNEKKLKFPCYIDAKLDGLRGVAIVTDEVKTYSRNGKDLKNYKGIEEELGLLKTYFKNPKTLKLDGEITGKDFQDIMRTVTRKEDGIEMASDAVYNIFDFMDTYPVPLKERLKYLIEIQEAIDNLKLKFIKVNRGKIVNTYEEALEYYNECLLNGFEGIMLKDLDAMYMFKRSINWMKMKPTDTEDFKIVGMKEGTGKYVGKLGALICELPNGDTVDVGTGFTDSEREEYWNRKDDIIGIVAEVQFQNKTNDGSLRFPVFRNFRKDKS